MKYLLIYSSRFGYTYKIAQILEKQWTAAGILVSVVNLNEAPALKLGDYDQIIIGASIRYGHYENPAKRLVISKQV